MKLYINGKANVLFVIFCSEMSDNHDTDSKFDSGAGSPCQKHFKNLVAIVKKGTSDSL